MNANAATVPIIASGKVQRMAKASTRLNSGSLAGCIAALSSKLRTFVTRDRPQMTKGALAMVCYQGRCRSTKHLWTRIDRGNLSWGRL